MVVVLAGGAGGIVETDSAMAGALVAGEGGSVEVEVLGFALVADCEVVAELATYFAGLAGQPGIGYVECSFRARSVAVEPYVVLIALPQAD